MWNIERRTLSTCSGMHLTHAYDLSTSSLHKMIGRLYQSLLYQGHVGLALHQAADLGMDIERDATWYQAMLRQRDSSGSLDDIIEMFARIGHKAKRLVEVVTWRQTDDAIRQRRATARPPRPPNSTTAGATGIQRHFHTHPAPNQAGGSGWYGSPIIPTTQGFNTAVPEDRHRVSGSSHIGSEPFVTLPEAEDLSQFFGYPQPTQITQEIVDEASTPVVAGHHPLTREIRPADRYSLADYKNRRAPTLARRPKRQSGQR